TLVVPALVKALRDQDALVRREAVSAVGQLGPAAQAAIGALTEVLKDAQGRDRILAAEALAYVVPGSPMAVSILAEMVADRNLGLRPQAALRSEEHTSELQSLAYLVCRLLLEKKKKI